MELMTRSYHPLGGRLTYGGGPPWQRLLRALPTNGVNTYFSAIFNSLTKFALGFCAPLRRRDREAAFTGGDGALAAHRPGPRMREKSWVHLVVGRE